MGYAQDIYDMDRGWTEATNELASDTVNAVKVCAHCEICRSSFVGMGPTSEAAMVEANESLASHSAKYHPVQS